MRNSTTLAEELAEELNEAVIAYCLKECLFRHGRVVALARQLQQALQEE